MLLRRRKRAGATLVETAIVYPVLFVIVFGIITLGIAVFRYQQVAHAAREGARYAAVHGLKYSQETGNPAATPDTVYSNAIAQHVSGLQAPDLTYAVTWTTSNAQTSSTTMIVGGQTKLVTKANTVSVTVTYSYHSGLFGVIPVSSTYVMPMSY
jgi:Flp pilus assembly protein TadG